MTTRIVQAGLTWVGTLRVMISVTGTVYRDSLCTYGNYDMNPIFTSGSIGSDTFRILLLSWGETYKVYKL